MSCAPTCSATPRASPVIGVDTVLAQVRPEEKAARIAELERAGQRVAVVGDGVNDAPALAQRTSGWRSVRAPTSRSRRPG